MSQNERAHRVRTHAHLTKNEHTQFWTCLSIIFRYISDAIYLELLVDISENIWYINIHGCNKLRQNPTNNVEPLIIIGSFNYFFI